MSWEVCSGPGLVALPFCLGRLLLYHGQLAMTMKLTDVPGGLVCMGSSLTQECLGWRVPQGDHKVIAKPRSNHPEPARREH